MSLSLSLSWLRPKVSTPAADNQMKSQILIQQTCSHMKNPEKEELAEETGPGRGLTAEAERKVSV